MALSFRFHSPYAPAFAHDPLPYLLDTIGSARQTLDLCVDALGVESIAAQVAMVRDRGVKVRWVVGLNATQGDEAGVEKLLAKHGFHRQTDWRCIRSEHAEFVQAYAVIDGQRVFCGTASWTAEGFYLQDALYAVVDSAEFAAAFLRATEVYWNESVTVSREAGQKDFIPEFVQSIESVSVGPDQRVSAFFMPFDGNVVDERLYEMISQAETSLSFALPSLSDPLLVDALEERARAGISIRGVLDAHRCRIEHFERAPALRALALSGKIRFLRAFGKTDKGLADLMTFRMVCADDQWIFFGQDRPETKKDIRWTGECAWLIDSIPVARQARHAVEVMFEMARDGGHRFSRWAHAEKYPYPKSWTIEAVPAAQSVRTVAKDLVKVAKEVVKSSKKKTLAKKPAPKKKAAPKKKSAPKRKAA